MSVSLPAALICIPVPFLISLMFRRTIPQEHRDYEDESPQPMCWLDFVMYIIFLTPRIKLKSREEEEEAEEVESNSGQKFSVKPLHVVNKDSESEIKSYDERDPHDLREILNLGHEGVDVIDGHEGLDPDYKKITAEHGKRDYLVDIKHEGKESDRRSSTGSAVPLRAKESKNEDEEEHRYMQRDCFVVVGCMIIVIGLWIAIVGLENIDSTNSIANYQALDYIVIVAVGVGIDFLIRTLLILLIVFCLFSPATANAPTLCGSQRAKTSKNSKQIKRVVEFDTAIPWGFRYHNRYLTSVIADSQADGKVRVGWMIISIDGLSTKYDEDIYTALEHTASNPTRIEFLINLQSRPHFKMSSALMHKSSIAHLSHGESKHHSKTESDKKAVVFSESNISTEDTPPFSDKKHTSSGDVQPSTGDPSGRVATMEFEKDQYGHGEASSFTAQRPTHSNQLTAPGTKEDYPSIDELGTGENDSKESGLERAGVGSATYHLSATTDTKKGDSTNKKKTPPKAVPALSSTNERSNRRTNSQPDFSVDQKHGSSQSGRVESSMTPPRTSGSDTSGEEAKTTPPKKEIISFSTLVGLFKKEEK